VVADRLVVDPEEVFLRPAGAAGQPPRRLPDPLRPLRRRAPRLAAGHLADAAGAGGGLHDAIFAETTYHAAYQPHRAIRTERWKYIRKFDEYPHPVLANCDDSDTKDLLVKAGWGGREVAEEQLYDLVLDPQEGRNLAYESAQAELRERLELWMRETDDPLLEGPVAPPPGAIVNEQWQVSPDDPVRIVTADSTAAPSR
jgi:arylsulfatase A-like enzyme